MGCRLRNLCGAGDHGGGGVAATRRGLVRVSPLPLEDTALVIAGTLGYLTEPQVNGDSRPATGNDVYGTYGLDFQTCDGGRFMIVALTPRHFRDLVRLTETTEAVDAVEKSLGADFSTDTDRFNHRGFSTSVRGVVRPPHDRRGRPGARTVVGAFRSATATSPRSPVPI